MLGDADPYPDNVEELKALLAAQRSLLADMEARTCDLENQNSDLAKRNRSLENENRELAEINRRLKALIRDYNDAKYGKKSEKLSPDQLSLLLEDIEQGIAACEAAREKLLDDEELKKETRAKKRGQGRASLPDHLPVEEVVIEPESKICPCCGAEMHFFDEDVSDRLDVEPAKFKIKRTRRPKYGCRGCEGKPVQAPASPAIIEGGLPTEALIAYICVSRFADHLPLYRLSQIFERLGVILHRSVLADWVGRAAYELTPIRDRLLAVIKSGDRIFADETTVQVLDPGRGQTKKGFLWGLARDGRPYGSKDPPTVAFIYDPSRGRHVAEKLLSGFSGVAQVDAYPGYNIATHEAREGGPVTLSYCVVHARRYFYKLATGKDPHPVALEALKWFAKLFQVEKYARGKAPDERRAIRQKHAAPILPAFKVWLERERDGLPSGSGLLIAIDYTLKHWDGLFLYIDDGRLEADSNKIESAMRPIAISRRNSLFSGHDQGAANWAVLASIIETCKRNGINPQAYLEDTLKKLANGWPQSRIDELLPFPPAEQADGERQNDLQCQRAN